MSPEFEFGANESKSFGAAGYWIGIVGRIWMLLGFLVILAGIAFIFTPKAEVPNMQAQGIQMALQGLLTLVLGYWTATAAKGFREIDSTQGRDVAHLVSAMDSLTSVYRLQAILIGIMCAIAILALAVMFFSPGTTEVIVQPAAR